MTQTVVLRGFQSELERGVYDSWQRGARVVMPVLPTGGGKTCVFSKMLRDNVGASCAIAHRQELVGQISLALARNAVTHRIIGPSKVVKFCVSNHMAELGRSYYNASAPVAVAGVDTLIRRQDDAGVVRWANSVTRYVIDEGHHVLRSNKWGVAAAMFPNALGLLPTATPRRADGNGLGRHADGITDAIVEGPSMRALINAGYLTDYRIFAPLTDIDLGAVDVSATTGDFNAVKLRQAVRRSRVVGDVVKHYLRLAPGKLGVTFATDVETAAKIAAEFNAAGVPAAVVSAETPDAERVAVLRRFRNRQLLQLVNVDLFGEGFDLPAIEVVSMARPTWSFSLYCQQFGRALRLMIDGALETTWDKFSDRERLAFIAASTKPTALIIDHVGNVVRHGLPDAPQVWSLDRREKRTGTGPTDVIPLRACPECAGVYERIFKACPYCGYVVEPAQRNGPEFVDGDLTELDAATLATMRGEVARVDMTSEAYRAELVAKHVPVIGQLANVKRHVKRQEAQEALRASIAWWAGYQRAAGRPDSESYRRFYFRFGVDVLTAQALGTDETLALADRVNAHLATGAA